MAETWNIEMETEVEEWLLGLDDDAFTRATFYIDLLEQQGPQPADAPRPPTQPGPA